MATTMKSSAFLEFIPTSEPVLDGKEKKYLLDCLQTNWISSVGKYIERFEEQFAHYIGTKYAVSCSNGTTAIHLAIASLGIERGDEILIPDFTIICSASMPILANVKPVLVDVDEYWCIDPSKIEDKITKKTKAIMAVHMYGNPANMEKILKIAKKHNLFVIEDACAAHGTTIGKKRVGSLGDVGCFSFYASKNITTGEGGMVVTNNKNVADKARLLRSHAFEKPRFLHNMLGFNYRLTNLQAALGVAQLERIDKKVAKRREIAKYYIEKLKDISEIDIMKNPPWGESVYWMFGILIKDSFGYSRDSVIELLAKKGIGSERFYTPMSEQPVFKKRKDIYYPNIKGAYPMSKEIGKRGLYIPSGLSLNKKHQDRVVHTLLSLIKR